MTKKILYYTGIMSLMIFLSVSARADYSERQAYSLYKQGLEAMKNRDCEQAQAFFEKAKDYVSDDTGRLFITTYQHEAYYPNAKLRELEQICLPPDRSPEQPPSPEQQPSPDPNPPSLILTSPNSPQISTPDHSFLLTGKIRDGYGRLVFTINSSPAAYDRNGNFNEKIILKPGENTLILRVEDENGQTDIKTCRITREALPPSLILTSPGTSQTSTGDSTFPVSGQIRNGYGRLTFKINGRPAGYDRNGNFDEKIALKPGENTLTLMVEDENGQTDIKTCRITREVQPLSLILTSPGTSQTSTGDSIFPVSGQIRNGYGRLTFKINGRPAGYDRNGNFDEKIALKPGENTLTLMVEDENGQTDIKTCRITRETFPELNVSLFENCEEQRGLALVQNRLICGQVTGGSGKFSVSVDGSPAEAERDGRFQKYIASDRRTVEIIAKDETGGSLKRVFQLKPQTQQSVALSGWYKKQYAIVIGIDKYQETSIPKLKNAVNDARAVAELFKNKMGFEVIQLFNSEATRKDIFNAIYHIEKKADKEDSFVFYFAGHGQGVKMGNRENTILNEGYIIPYDADIDFEEKNIMYYDDQAVSLDRLEKYIKPIKAKHKALILDSCFSGLVMNQKWRAIPQSNFNKEYYEDLLARGTVNILTAGDDQPVSDGKSHSPFTQALLNALDKGNVDLDDRDGFVVFSKLANYIKEKVERQTKRRQRPQFDNLSMDDGDFIFQVSP
jgi:hypothetical protein